MAFGLLGHNIAHSFSPLIHHMIGAYNYNIFDIDAKNLQAFFEESDFNGLNVTTPYKQKVFDFVEADSIATKLGAINTIYFKDGKLIGTNTDFWGFMYLLSLHNIKLEKQRILILGTGGASNIVKHTAQICQAKDIFIATRQEPVALQRNTTDDTCKYVSYKHLPRDIDVIINATPVGNYPNIDNIPGNINLSKFDNLHTVIDLNYNPAKTKILLEAEKLGKKAVNGLSMLVAQATKASEYFIGQNFTEYNQAILSQLKALTYNITLIGMPGCGKTTIGKELAKLTERKFIDTDVIIEHETNMSISNIFNKYDEEHFRKLEFQTLTKYSKESGLIIATGGGCVENPINIDHIKQNSIVVYIEQDTDKLDTALRPLSDTTAKLQKIWKRRRNIYENNCDIKIFNNASPLAISNEILDKITRLF